MALCLEDENKRIADLTRLFFAEFSRKVRKVSFTPYIDSYCSWFSFLAIEGVKKGYAKKPDPAHLNSLSNSDAKFIFDRGILCTMFYQI